MAASPLAWRLRASTTARVFLATLVLGVSTPACSSTAPAGDEGTTTLPVDGPWCSGSPGYSGVVGEPAPPASTPARSEPWPVRPGQLMATIQAADPRHTDIVDLLSQAQGLANRLQPGAKLVQIYASEVMAGMIDITKSAAASCGWRTTPPNRSIRTS